MWAKRIAYQRKRNAIKENGEKVYICKPQEGHSCHRSKPSYQMSFPQQSGHFPLSAIPKSQRFVKKKFLSFASYNLKIDR